MNKINDSVWTSPMLKDLSSYTDIKLIEAPPYKTYWNVPSGRASGASSTSSLISNLTVEETSTVEEMRNIVLTCQVNEDTNTTATVDNSVNVFRFNKPASGSYRGRNTTSHDDTLLETLNGFWTFDLNALPVDNEYILTEAYLINSQTHDGYLYNDFIYNIMKEKWTSTCLTLISDDSDASPPSYNECFILYFCLCNTSDRNIMKQCESTNPCPHSESKHTHIAIKLEARQSYHCKGYPIISSATNFKLSVAITSSSIAFSNNIGIHTRITKNEIKTFNSYSTSWIIFTTENKDTLNGTCGGYPIIIKLYSMPDSVRRPSYIEKFISNIVDLITHEFHHDNKKQSMTPITSPSPISVTDYMIFDDDVVYNEYHPHDENEE